MENDDRIGFMVNVELIRRMPKKYGETTLSRLEFITDFFNDLKKAGVEVEFHSTENLILKK